MIIYVGDWVRLGVGGTVCQLVACWEQEREKEKKWRGERRQSVGVRYLLLVPCASLQALGDINGEAKAKIALPHRPELAPLLAAQPRVSSTTKCKLFRCDPELLV